MLPETAEPDGLLSRRAAVRRVARPWLIAIALVGIVTLVGACSSQTTPSPATPILTVEARGGECVGVPCDMTTFVERDGRVHISAKPPNDIGVVPADALAALDAAIRATDFAALRSHPFTGQCPTAFDGQELVFTFGAPSGLERISSCEVAIDYGSPLFVAVSTAIGPFVSVPTT
jgi:hypothetical protein